MQRLTAEINLNDEVTALASYINLKWHPPMKDISAIITEIRDLAKHDARARLDKQVVWEAAVKYEGSRAENLSKPVPESDRDLCQYYDLGCCFFAEVSRTADLLAECGENLDGPWNYSRKFDEIGSRILAKYPDLAKARPIGWDALVANYANLEGLDEYDPASDEVLFAGSDVPIGYGPQFVGRTELSYVMYDEMRNGRTAASTLINAVYMHFLGIYRFLNTARVLDALGFVARALPQTEMVFAWTIETNDPALAALLQLSDRTNTQENFQEELTRRAAERALPAAVREANQITREARIEAVSAELLAEIKAEPDPSPWYLARKENCTKLLKQMFGA